jgi:hypothetical protein
VIALNIQLAIYHPEIFNSRAVFSKYFIGQIIILLQNPNIFCKE